MTKLSGDSAIQIIELELKKSLLWGRKLLAIEWLRYWAQSSLQRMEVITLWILAANQVAAHRPITKLCNFLTNAMGEKGAVQMIKFLHCQVSCIGETV